MGVDAMKLEKEGLRWNFAAQSGAAEIIEAPRIGMKVLPPCPQWLSR